MRYNKYLNYVFVLLIFAILLYFGNNLSDSTARILLRPYVWMAEIFFSNAHEYVLNVGYVEGNNRYIIGYGCLGINFTALLFVMCTAPYIKHFNGFSGTLWIILCFIGSVITGFFANTMRIIGSIPFSLHEKFNLIHASLGIVIYLSFLIFFQVILSRIFERKIEV